MPEERLDRQLRIAGWNQSALDETKVGVVGDDDLLASLYVMSAAALGLRHLVVVAPGLDERLVETGRRLNSAFNLCFLEGYYTHSLLDDIFAGCGAIVDLSRYGLANKLLLQKGFREGVPIIRGFCDEEGEEQGFKVFTYTRGREWRELEQIVAPQNCPGKHWDDGVLDIIVAGMVLEETKNLLMGERVSEDLITYRRQRLSAPQDGGPICVVGAGALGNFVGLGLAYSGFRHITFIDPDLAEVTNLNRQVFLYDAVGSSKADVLAERLRTLFGTDARAQVAYVRRETDLSEYAGVFDCVDNFETRIVLSEKCKDQNKVLISGGSHVGAGQVIVYDPSRGGPTPAELLGLYEVVDRREVEGYQRRRASCAYDPDPSVIMTNEIIAGFMVESYRMLLGGGEVANVFYESTSLRI